LKSSLEAIFYTQLFPRVFGHEDINHEINLHNVIEILKSKSSLFTDDFKSKRKTIIKEKWTRQLIRIWNSQNLDPEFMHHISNHLKLDFTQDHIGLENMKPELFKMIIFFENENINYMRMMNNIYLVLLSILNEREAYRRMLTLSKQFSQIQIENLKPKIQNSIATPTHMFDDAQAGEYERTFDFFGYYGLKDEGESNKRDEIEHKHKFEINKKQFNFYFSTDHSSSDTGTDQFFTKYMVFHDIISNYAYMDRVSPRIHFPPDGDISQFISESNYMNLIKSEDFILALDRNGVSLNRILTIVLILQLEEENMSLEFKGEDFYYMAKVLCKIMSPQSYNFLEWLQTSERRFLQNHYKGKYSFQFRVFLSKLKEIPEEQARESYTASYPPNIDGLKQALRETRSDIPTNAHYKLADSIFKRRIFIEELKDLDEILPLQLYENLKNLEGYLN
jgi:hypothetical protein